jgi:hypothetical protein
MSRAGYSDDLDPLDLGRWRAQVASAIRGKRGQAFFRQLIEALDAMPEKRLVTGDLQDDSGCVCTLGALAKHKGADLEQLDTYDYDDLGQRFNIAHQLAQEVMFENDEHGTWANVDGAWVKETPEMRWQRMRKWAEKQLKDHLTVGERSLDKRDDNG